MRTTCPGACIITRSMLGHGHKTPNTQHSRSDYLTSVDANQRASWEATSQSMEDLASEIMQNIRGTRFVVSFLTLKIPLGWHQLALLMDVRQDRVNRTMLFDPNKRTHAKSKKLQEPFLPGPVQELLRLCQIDTVQLVRGSQLSDLECVIHVTCFIRAILSGYTVWNQKLIEGTWHNVQASCSVSKN